MELTKREMLLAKEALGYGVMFSKSEAETAEFAMLKIKIESNLLRIEQNKIPELCPVCNKKCSGFVNSYTNDGLTLIESTFFHHSSKLNNCTKKYQ